jgi:hypothetical protein
MSERTEKIIEESNVKDLVKKKNPWDRYYRQITFQVLTIGTALIGMFFAPLLVALPIIAMVLFGGAMATKLWEDYHLNKEKFDRENIKANDLESAITKKIEVLKGKSPELNDELTNQAEQIKQYNSQKNPLVFFLIAAH